MRVQESAQSTLLMCGVTVLHYALCVVVAATHYSCSTVLPNECTIVFTTGSVHRKAHGLLDKDLHQLGRSSLIAQSFIRAPPHFDVVHGRPWEGAAEPRHATCSTAAAAL